MDVLSGVLRTVQLEGAFFFNARFSAPWKVFSPASADIAPVLSHGTRHLIIYHLLTEGRAWASIDEGAPVNLAAGDILVFPHGHAHAMGNGRAKQAMNASEALPEILARHLNEVVTGGGGETTRFVCGYMACDPITIQPLLACLPPLLKVSIRERESGRWLEESIRLSVHEAAAANPGSEVVLARLSEVLFLETIRGFLEDLPAEEKGWLAGARDAVVGRTLMLLHQAPSRQWTIADLATEVGASRSVLVQRFTEFVGEPPISYVASWRMRLAAKSLMTSNRTVLEIASDVGYESEAAFNRAFKRHFGKPPAQYRRAARGMREVKTEVRELKQAV